MEFCQKCGGLMVVKKKRTRSFLNCPKCGKERPLKREKLMIKEAIHSNKKEVVVMGKDAESIELPKTKIICPKCEHAHAYWWMQQTRSSDEAPTIFYRCVSCQYSWRSYG